MIFNTLRHLLPTGRAWRQTVDKQLRQYFQGLGAALDDVKTFIDEVWGDIFPDTTREIFSWESQFGLRSVDLTEQERRDRLDATWKALGGQSPRYIQDTLQNNGFDLYVHEWWIPATVPSVDVPGCATPYNPNAWLQPEYIQYLPETQCGEALAECGEEDAVSVGNPTLALLMECGAPLCECGEAVAECGNSQPLRGYPLVNKISEITPDILPLCGEIFAECGEETAECNNFFRYNETFKLFPIPDDPDKWPYFLYIGAPVFGDIATVPVERRNELEALILKIRPAQQWLGMFVEYTL